MIGNGQIKMVEMVILVQYIMKRKVQSFLLNGLKEDLVIYRWCIDTKFGLKIVDACENFCNKNHGSNFFAGKKLVQASFASNF